MRQLSPDILFGLLLLAVLTATSLQDYLLFHTLVEMFSIVALLCIFLLVASARGIAQNGYVLLIGAACLPIGCLDLLHAMSYKGMNAFWGNNANLPTQLWIAARALQASAFLAAPLFARGRWRFEPMLILAIASFGLLAGLIFTGHFPDCFVEGVGLTQFKVGAECVISGALVAALVGLWTRRAEFAPRVLGLLSASICLTIASEISFAVYASVYGPANFFGHLFKFISFLLLTMAVLRIGFTAPKELLFHRLAESESRLREAQAIARIGSFDWDSSSGRVHVSDEFRRLLNLPVDQPVTDFEQVVARLDPSDAHRLRSALETLGAEEFADIEVGLQGEKSEAAGQLRCRVERVSGGDIGRISCTLRDVTPEAEARRLREDIERISRHDLKSPAVSIVYLARFLAATPLNGEQEGFTRQIKELAMRICEQIGRSLDILRMERGAYELAPEPLDLLELVRRALAEAAPLAGEKGITTSLLVDGRPARDSLSLPAAGEALLLASAFSNLIANAVEASPQNAAITVRLYPRNGDMVVEIENQGEVPAVMRPVFFKKHSTYGKKRGSGLGAYSARLIAEAHGGSVEFDTGGGSTRVRFILPDLLSPHSTETA